MNTNKHRVLPVTEDLEDTVELPSLPSLAEALGDAPVAHHMGAGEATEEILRLPLVDSEQREGRREDLARIAALERDLATGVEQHRLSEAERDNLRLRLERVQAELHDANNLREQQAAVQATQRSDWERERSQREGALLRAHNDLVELRRRSAAHDEALQHLEGRRYLFDSMLREREELLDERDARLQSLAVELAQAQAQAAGARAQVEAARAETESAQAMAQAKLNAMRARVDELATELAQAQAATAASQQQHSAALSGITDLQRAAADHEEALQALHEQLRAAQLGNESLRGDLAAAEDLIRTMEREQQQRAVRIARLESNEIALRARLATAEHLGEKRAAGVRDAAAEMMGTGGEAGAAALRGSAAGRDSMVRLLVRTEGDTGIVHLLRRTTTIGRTPDNDLCIDADFISRHHAVVLVSAFGAVIEDLNSTNGVFVNGVKVGRRQLCEGDLVTIGRTGFRYVLKPQAADPDGQTTGAAAS
ncbi:MAG: FHA domain-containing protein [Steroidobacteraceae bacterium]